MTVLIPMQMPSESSRPHVVQQKNPKILHRVYFSDMAPFTDPFEHFLETWHREMPDYTIMNWNGSNLDLGANEWVRRAASSKSPVFLSEYFRWWALATYGGVYLDADCEILNGNKLSRLIDDVFDSDAYDAAVGVEEYQNGHPTAQSVIARKNSGLVQFMLGMYERELSGPFWHWREERGLIGPQLMSLYFIEAGLSHTKGMFWRLDDPTVVGRVKVYTQDYFSPKFTIDGEKLRYTENTCVYHLFANFNMSWDDEIKNNLRKRPMLFHEYLKFLENKALDVVAPLEVENITELLKQGIDPGVGNNVMSEGRFLPLQLSVGNPNGSKFVKRVVNSIQDGVRTMRHLVEGAAKFKRKRSLRVLHRIYFGFDGKPDSLLGYLESWKRELPDYEICYWNADNLPLNLNAFTRRTAADRDHAFLSDYFRWWVLREYGGVYLDADVEVVDGKKFDVLISELDASEDYDAFIGIDERSGGWYTAHTMASKKGSKLATTMCEVYEHLGLVAAWRKKDFYLMAPQLTALYFATNQHNVDGMGTTPHLVEPIVVERVKIYPQDYFSPVSPQGLDQGMALAINGLSSRTSLCHHFGCSWHDDASPYSVRAHSFRQAGNVLLKDILALQLESSMEDQYGVGARLPYSIDHAAVKTAIGLKTAKGLVIDGTRAGAGLFGPYVDLPPGSYRARFFFVPGSIRVGTAGADVVSNSGQRKLAEIRVDCSFPNDDVWCLEFVAPALLNGVEMRVICDQGFQGIIERIEFEVV